MASYSVFWSRLTAASLFAGVGAGCQPVPPTPVPPPEQELQISVSSSLDSVTIVAQNVSRLAILAELRTDHGIEVRPLDAPDSIISVRIVDAPLQNAISRLLPEGTPFVLRVRDREVAVAPTQQGAKIGPADTRPPRLPTKDRTRPLPDSLRTSVKVDPADWRQPTPQFGDTLKPDPVRVTTVVPGRGPKSARQAVPVDSAGRFSFTITAPDTIRLTRAVLVDGDAVESPVVKGPFLFVLRAASGNIVHVGSLVDPLEEHSFLVDSTHTVGRAREGSFGLWIPGRLLGTQQLVGLTLEFYDARGVTLPPTLDVRSVGDFLPQARSLTRFPGTALVSALQRGAQQ